MFWWIFGFIAIALAIFLIYKRINSLTINKSKEPQLKPNVETAPQIDTGAITSNLPNLNEEGNTTSGQTRIEVSNTRQATTTTHIEWTEELREIRRIMQLAPTKRKSNLGKTTSTTTKRYENDETLSIEELYKLAKQFAKLIEEADNLRNLSKLTEERDFCINAIKWCAKNGVSVIYWQCRINQINKIEGRPAIKLDSISTRKSDRSSSAQSTPKKKILTKLRYLGFLYRILITTSQNLLSKVKLNKL